MKILLVDDRVENRYLGQTLLHGAGYEVETAPNGAEALAKLRDGTFDLIISDIMMPKMDGFQLCRELKRDPTLKTLPFIFYTATYTDSKDEAFARSLGVTDFLAKPIDAEVFLDRVRQAFSAKPIDVSPPTLEEPIYFKEYSHRLVAKLEQKIHEVESTNSKLRDLNDSLEDRIREKTEKLEIKNKELESFVYSVAHDLRAPLRALQGLSNALLDDHVHSLDETGRDYADRIAKSARKMDVLIQDLLDYSRLAHSEVAVHLLEPETVIKDVIEQIAPTIKERCANISIEPPFPVVSANPSALGQIINNLILNAIKFVPEGTSPIVRISSEERGQVVRIWVQDNGIGIDAKDQRRIFAVFERLHDAKDYPGTGLGLAIVQKAAERLGGTVGVESVPGHGSRFWVDLPRSSTGAAPIASR